MSETMLDALYTLYYLILTHPNSNDVISIVLILQKKKNKTQRG